MCVEESFSDETRQHVPLAVTEGLSLRDHEELDAVYLS